jgi:hypothetical protein
MHLMKFVCSFAWADLEIRPEERAFIEKMVKKLDLSADEKAQVDEWLRMPPPIEEIDPTRIPRAHRQLFIDAARATIVVDGRIDPEEEENLRLLELLANA